MPTKSKKTSSAKKSHLIKKIDSLHDKAEPCVDRALALSRHHSAKKQKELCKHITNFIGALSKLKAMAAHAEQEAKR